MSFRLILFCFILIAINDCYTQSWEIQQKPFSNLPVKKIKNTSENNMVIILGEKQHEIVEVKNSSLKKLFSSDNIILDVFYFENTFNIVEKNRILHLDSTGSISRELNINFDAIKVLFIDQRLGYAISTEGKILRTIDGGYEWDILNISNVLDCYFRDSLNGFIISHSPFGHIYKTTDGGNTWMLFYGKQIHKEPAFYISSNNSSVTYNIDNNSFLVSTDGGINWEERNINFTGGHHIKYAIKDSNIIVHSINKIFYTSSDNGRTWLKKFNSVIYDKNKNLNHVEMEILNDSTFVTGGLNGALYRTEDKGESWISLTQSSFLLSTGFFIDELTGWLAGENILKTTNGGNFWISVFVTPEFIYDIFFINRDIGFALSSDNEDSATIVLKTGNGGLKWDTIYNPNIYTPLNIYFRDSLNGYMVGEYKDGFMVREVFYQTSDQGTTWTKMTSLGGKDIQFVGNTGFITGTNKFYNSVDLGKTWTKINTIEGNLISFIDSLYGFVAGKDHILKTTDGGLTFNYVLEPTICYGFSSLKLFSKLDAIVESNCKYEVLRTTNGGDNWEKTLSFPNGIFNTVFVNKNLGWAFGNDTVSAGNVLKYVDSLSVVNVNEELLKSFYYLSDNFPNPFNPSTTIVYSIPVESFVEIKLFDMLGKEIITLLNENKLAGNYNLVINMEHLKLSAGVYVYTMKAGEFTATKKMLLLK